MRVRTVSVQSQSESNNITAIHSNHPCDIICKIYPPVFLDAEGLTDDLLHAEITSAVLLPGKESAILIPENAQKSWTPEEPWLYPYSLEYGEDRVLGYFTLRKCDVQLADDGYPRLFLNNHPYFQSGILDQGYWPDGLDRKSVV